MVERLVAEGSVDDEGTPGKSAARMALWEGEARRSEDMVVGSRVGGGGESRGAVGGRRRDSQV